MKRLKLQLSDIPNCSKQCCPMHSHLLSTPPLGSGPIVGVCSCLTAFVMLLILLAWPAG